MKPSLMVAALAVTVPFLLHAPAAQAAIIVYQATLSGANEDPPNASPGTGWATVTYDDVVNTMRIEAQFSGLLGTTTTAHIHCCTATPTTGNAAVATTVPSFPGFPTEVTSGSYDMTFDLGAVSTFNPGFLTNPGLGVPSVATAALFTAMDEGRAYFNIHTTMFPGGEIRGFLVMQSVPEPGTALLLALGAAALAAGGGASARRARRQAA